VQILQNIDFLFYKKISLGKSSRPTNQLILSTLRYMTSLFNLVHLDPWTNHAFIDHLVIRDHFLSAGCNCLQYISTLTFLREGTYTATDNTLHLNSGLAIKTSAKFPCSMAVSIFNSIFWQWFPWICAYIYCKPLFSLSCKLNCDSSSYDNIFEKPTSRGCTIMGFALK